MKKNLLVITLSLSAISIVTVSCKKENAFVYPVNTITSNLLSDTPYRHTNTIMQDTPYLQVNSSYTDTPYLRK